MAHAIRDVVAVRQLPRPALHGTRTVERALHERRSVREYTGVSLTLADLAQLLWAAQGVTSPDGLRTAPSAGALYPLEVSVAVGEVDGLPGGVYRYEPPGHALALVAAGDPRTEIARAALDQECVAAAAAVIAFAAVYGRTTGKYGERGRRYVHMEVGHAAQNVCLQAVAAGLGAVVVGAFEDRALRTAFHLARGEEPLGLVCVGRPR